LPNHDCRSEAGATEEAFLTGEEKIRISLRFLSRTTASFITPINQAHSKVPPSLLAQPDLGKEKERV
jgi:hypothetical protein